MKYLLLLLALCLTGCGTTKVTNNGTVNVTSTGRTFDEAKNNGFKQAVEIAVGAVVLSTSESRNDKLVRDDILKHSSGYVDDYTILNKIIEPNKVTLVMEVKVGNSRIAERLISIQSSDGKLQGDKLYTQQKTYRENRNTGDRLLREVLNDYPKHALNIKKGSVEFKVDRERNIVIVVPYELRWNYNYLVALNEVLSNTHDGKMSGYKQDRISVSSKNPDNWILGNTTVYYFNDSIRADMIRKSFVGQIYTHVTIRDNVGNLLIRSCPNEGLIINGLHGVDPFFIRGNEYFQREVNVKINRAYPKMNKLESATNIEVSFGSSPCTNFE